MVQYLTLNQANIFLHIFLNKLQHLFYFHSQVLLSFSWMFSSSIYYFHCLGLAWPDWCWGRENRFQGIINMRLSRWWWMNNICYGWDSNFVIEGCFALNCTLNSFKLSIILPFPAIISLLVLEELRGHLCSPEQWLGTTELYNSRGSRFHLFIILNASLIWKIRKYFFFNNFSSFFQQFFKVKI